MVTKILLSEGEYDPLGLEGVIPPSDNQYSSMIYKSNNGFMVRNKHQRTPRVSSPAR